jgi:MFS transporter, MHS family, citrate/tricarballylate:H+ symporter
MQIQKSSTIRSALRVSSGNFLEMYDFMIFGYFATDIGRAFFPSGSAFLSLMLALMTFGAGFLMRPVGALILGAYIDRHGRRQGLLLTLGLMSIGTVALTITPTYASIGILAPIIVLLSRLLQGFSAGVELGGTSIYLAEIATPGNLGFYVSFQSASQQVAVVVAASIGYLLNQILPVEAMSDWGWRIPLGFGCLIVPFLFIIRSSLHETEAFKEKKVHHTLRQILPVLWQNWHRILIGFAMVIMANVSFYTITAYTPTFAGHELHLDSSTNLFATLCVGLSNLILLPIMGALSDKVGRRPLMFFATALALVTAYPALSWLMQSVSLTRLLTVELWLSFLYATYNGALVVYLTEIMPFEVRTTGFSLAYSASTATFGGFTPAICTYLIELTGDRAIPGAWVSLAALIALTATVLSGRILPNDGPQ